MNIHTGPSVPLLMWTPGDAPELHPMWEIEVELERGMLRAGADKVRDRVIIAESRGQMTRVGAVRGLMTEWLPGVADAIKSWVKDVERTRGVKPIALPYVKAMDPYVAALIALRTVLNGIARVGNKLVGVAMEIGYTSEHEQRVRHWEGTEPALYHHYREEMDRNKATATHRRRVNINRFNHLLSLGDSALQWDPWSEEVRFRVGVALLDCLIRKTGWFELQPDPNHTYTGRGRFKGPQLVVAAREGFTSWLGNALDAAEVSSPEHKPTVMPPRRWSNGERGGYWTPYVRTPRLVRFKASQQDQRDGSADEYDALDMPHVFDAIHLLQETAWQVNTRVLDVAVAVWAKAGDASIAGLPQIDEKPFPARTPRMLEHAEAVAAWKAGGRQGVRPIPDPQTDKEIVAWKRKASPVYRFNAKRVSKLRATSTTILIAQEYAGFEAIYFPHMLDFRGRIYPIANFLQPQGSDLARGLLTFSEGLPITEENGGAGWLAIQLANSWGNDKVGFEERIAWVEEREDLWRRIAEDPLANSEWMVTEGPNKVDKPFQALASIFEWVDFLNEGWGFVSRLPVMVDGTCNGIQHLSAILRDEVAGRYVNLIPSDRPQDIYKVVATGTPPKDGEETETDRIAQEAVLGLQHTLERIEAAGGIEGEKAGFWLALCDRNLPRTLTKRQVMVLPYGGTKDSFFTYTRKWLDEFDPAPEPSDEEMPSPAQLAVYAANGVTLIDGDEKPRKLDDLERDLRTKRIVFLAGHLWDTVNQVVHSGMSVMKWLQDCAKAVAVANQPIYWTVPSGFVVRHFYGLSRSVVHKLLLDGARVEVTRNEKTAQLSTKEQAQGIAPNFIHSLDASCLVECLKRCREAGIEEFSSVHDAYGTHAANMGALSKFLREAFVATHEVDVLANFRADCQRVLTDWLVVGDPSGSGKEGMDPLEASEKANEMLPVPLEKGGLDLSLVLESDYFFA